MVTKGSRYRLAFSQMVLLVLSSCLPNADMVTYAEEAESATKSGESRQREDWERKLSCLKAGMTASEVENSVKDHGGYGNPHDYRGWHRGGGISYMTYGLDDDSELYVNYEGIEPASQRLRSFKVIGFGDLKRDIEAELYPIVKIIHDHGARGMGWGPVPLIRVVNKLHPFGKDRVLAALRSYAHLTQKYARQEEALIYGLKDEQVFLILRLLFVRTDGDPEMPAVGFGAPLNIPRGADTSGWPLFPLVLEHEIPFDLVVSYRRTNKPPSPLKQIEYCQVNCDLRDRPLTPTVSPIKAVVALLGSERWKRLFPNNNGSEAWTAQHLGNQALAALSSVGSVDREAPWQKQMEALEKLKPRWDSKNQIFVSGIPGQ